MSRLQGVVALTLAAQATATFTFYSLGDWGGAELSNPQYAQNVRGVAQAMASHSVSGDPPAFIIGTGDNFYYCGIQNTTDSQINTDWVTPYGSVSPSLTAVPWYNVLGNHEYGYNVDAQVQLDTQGLLKNWNLPARYYTKRIMADDGVYISFIFIDTSPCVSAYRSTDPSGWDPCSTQYPTCSIRETNDDFEGACEFHNNIMTQSCTDQYTWFQQQLSQVPQDDWLIVVGHHPADELDVEDFVTPMVNRGFSLYVNGHAHTLTQYALNGKGSYVTTGAGSMILSSEKNTRDTSVPSSNRTYRKEESLSLDANVFSQQYTEIWNDKVSGYTIHTLSDDMTQLTTAYVNTQGQTIHSFVVDKQGNPPSGPNPPPNPGPPPPPGGSTCCFYHNATCTAGQVCCTSECSDPSTCSYTQEGCDSKYGAIHGCHWTGTNCVVKPSALHAQL